MEDSSTDTGQRPDSPTGEPSGAEKDPLAHELVVRPGVKWMRSGSEAVIVDVESKAYCTLNGTGLALWEALVEGGRLDRAVESIAASAGIEREQVMADARGFVKKMLDARLVEPRVRP
jgi:hypothetical protein